MKQVDEELRGLFRSVRGADDPTPRQRERNRRRVVARIAAIGVSLPGVAVAMGASTATVKFGGIASAASSLWSTLRAGAFVGFSAVTVVGDRGPKSSLMQASVPDVEDATCWP